MKSERTAELPTVKQRTQSDITRAHALNWALSIGALVLCALVGAWILARALLDLSIPSDIIWLILLAPISGAVAGSIKLIQFTEEYRCFLYAVEDALQVDINNDGEIGQPQIAGDTPRGSFLMTGDGTRHRIDTELSAEEVKAVKRLLLTSGKATVRGLTAVVGDRASALRQDLITLGICEEPDRKNAAAAVSVLGREGVMRW